MKIIQLAIPYDPEAPEDEEIVFADGTTPEEVSENDV